ALRSGIENHTVGTPYILTIDQGQTLEEAIDCAIAPKEEIRQKVISAVHNSYMTKQVSKKTYSKRKKKYIYTKKKIRVRSDFQPGVYIVTFGRNYTIKNVIRTNNIPFNPKAYQNQQFFKNSCLAEKTKERAL
ncbi:MAG: hypothetical protein ACRCUT_06935, partial [Spirochaetota bacterium]